MQLSRKQIFLIMAVTLTWGLNWPVMKMGVTGFPPLTFRALCLWIGVPVLGLALVALKVRGPNASLRAARFDDVTHVRWALKAPIPVGGSGRLSFRGTVK